jgi:anti-sigma B factor antagonist
MMIHKTQTGSTITLALSGKLDSVTQSELAQELETVFAASITGLVFDLLALDYISSAGLRVLLLAQKKINSLGATMKIVGANESVKEIFRITGFAYDD